MANSYFRFKQFTIQQDRCAMKVTTDACLFGAWAAARLAGDAPMDMLDIGTGTGLLPLMVAQQAKTAHIDTIEVEQAAVEQARENVNASLWAERIHCLQGDARQYDFERSYDCIISNPPFYENELASPDPGRGIAHHGESLRLGDLTALLKKWLKPGGSFFLLLPFKRMEEMRQLMANPPLQLTEICLVRQSVNHDYFRILLRGEKLPAVPVETRFDELAVKDVNDGYTQEFAGLLSEYYLYL